MKVYLSNTSPSDQSFKHCSNLAALDAVASDSEITKLTIDCFLCSFSFEEAGAAMAQILKKCRMNCEVTVMEADCNILFRLYTRGDIDLEYFNTLFFESSKKCILNMPTIESLIPENFKVEEKYISNSAYSIVKLRRVK
tara:strand:- start:4212 stop:4628 length:417 start_codon:yes stop_codon:yes gene_type:complete